MIKFRCSHCQQKLGVPDEYAGRRIRCNKCSQPGTVPQPAVSQIPIVEVLTPQIPPDPAPKEPDAEFNTIANDEAARMEAIRLAAKNRGRASKIQSREKGGGRSESRTSGRSKSDRLTLQEMIPDVLRLPLGIVCGFAAAGLTVLLWVICSRTTANALCFMAIFVPVAVAYAFRGLIVERGFLIGVLAVAVGGLSIAGGKAAIAHFVVIPFFQETADEEILVNLKSLMADPKLQYTSAESIKPFARDGDYMTCAGLVAMVEEGLADPVKARAWAVHIMQHSNKLSLLEMFDSATGGGTTPEPIPDLTSEDESVFENVSMRLAQWSDEETELQMARKYYPAVAKITQQAKILHTFEDRKLTYQLAFLNTLGLFDLVWIFAGLGIGYAVTVFD